MCPWFVSSSIIPSIFRYFCEKNFLNRSACFWFLLPYAFTSSVAGCCCWWWCFWFCNNLFSKLSRVLNFFPANQYETVWIHLFQLLYFQYSVFCNRSLIFFVNSFKGRVEKVCHWLFRNFHSIFNLIYSKYAFLVPMMNF